MSDIASRADRASRLLAHAWVLRAFLRRCEEVETQYPELLQVARAIFDVARAAESRREAAGDAEFLRVLEKKLHRLKRAAELFDQLAPEISVHTNLAMAHLSFDTLLADLEQIVRTEEPAPPESPAGP